MLNREPPAPSPQPSSRTHPTLRARLTTLARTSLWACWLASLAAYVFAYAMPTDLLASGSTHLTFAFVAFMLRTFILHAGIAMTVLAVLALIFRARRLFVLSCIFALALCWPTLRAITRPASPAPNPQQPTLTLVVANVNLGNPDLSKLISLINAENADVVILQEITPAHIASLRSALSVTHPHRSEALRSDAFGQAIYSRIPFQSEPQLFPQGTLLRDSRLGGVVGLHDPQIRTTISFDGLPVVIQNLHLVPPGDPSMLREQRVQFAWLRDWLRSMATSPNPSAVILAGDFNSTPSSPQHAVLRAAGLIESHAQAGQGTGHTWPDIAPLSNLPGIRIDHVYSTSELRAVEARVGPSIGSDHRPQVVRLVKAK
ncbi:MAG: endonuclease/exonuclease/phosphatase family protein [Phycisphaerales bacterium]|nr:endonuclease/exonuclease/phosphatase family protein [Phycisphaerales bacterium]